MAALADLFIGSFASISGGFQAGPTRRVYVLRTAMPRMSPRGTSVRTGHGTRHRLRRAHLGLAFTVLLVVGLWLALQPRRATEVAPRATSPLPRQAAVRPTPTGAPQAFARALEAPETVTGTVRSAGGVPLRDASICALDHTDRSAVAVCSATDAAGQFELREFPDTADTLVASAPGFLSKECPLRTGACSAPRESALNITLEPGGVEVSGRVVDALGGVVPGALVTLRSLGAPSWTAAALADAEGRFAVHVGEGDVEIDARAESYSLASVQARAPARGIVLVLAPEAQLLGRVVHAVTLEPVAEVKVRVQSIPDGVELANVGVSDAEGNFLINGIRGGGQFHVTASSDSWGGAEHWVTLDVGQVSEPLILRVLPATSLTGTVRREDGPCANATVAAIGRVGIAAEAAPDGQVRLNGLLPGPYQISISCPQALPLQESLDVGREPVLRDWTVQSGLSVSGKVEGPGGRPIAGAVVAITPVGEPVDTMPVSCTTGASGAFSCSGLSPGEYECELSDTADSARERLHVALQDSDLTGLLLRTGPAAAIRVSVTGGATGTSDGSSAPRVFARDVSFITTEATRRDNAFVFDAMPLGRYQVYIDRLTANGGPSDVQLEYDGQVVDLELAAPELLSIAGRVLDERGAPWLDAWVRVEASNATAGISTATHPPALSDGAGEFLLTGLVAGLYDLHVSNAESSTELRGVAAGSAGVVVQRQAEVASTRASEDSPNTEGMLPRAPPSGSSSTATHLSREHDALEQETEQQGR